MMMILVFALVILGIIAFVKRMTNTTKPGSDHDPAMTLLRRQYASGEITKKVFKERRQDLTE